MKKTFIYIAFLLLAVSCSKDEPPYEKAQVATNACNESDITETTAIVSANITKAGVPSYTERGICWSTNSNPTVSNNKQTAIGSGQTGSYSCTITWLTANTTYYAKAYLIQDGATIYGNEISFKTKEETETAQVATNACNDSDITETTAIVSANITKAGVPPYTEKGICWSTHSNPTIYYNTETAAGSDQADSYSCTITGLTENTTYYARAYLIQNGVAIYGNVITLKTKEAGETKIRELLVKLYNDTNGEGWVNKDNWLSDKPINEWYGVHYKPGYLQIALLDNNLIGTIDLSSCTALATLDCSSNLLTSLDVSSCTALTELYCGGNQLTSLNASSCTALAVLDCPNNQLTSLNASGCTALEWLNCHENQLTNLNASGCTALIYLLCENNQLTTLDASNLPALTDLWCNDNQLTSLDVSGCIALAVLKCDNNQLTSLNMNGCTALAYLGCNFNQLTSINVSGLTALTTLYCTNNQLTSLNVSGCTALEWLGCHENQLISINVSGLTALISLYCANNQLTNTALNTVFGILPDRSSTTPGSVYITSNPGSSTCAPSIAEAKGWYVER